MKKLIDKLMGRHNERGEEVLDPTPIEVPLKFRRPETMTEKMRRMIAVEMSQYAERGGFETFEEADDFDVEDDPEPVSQHELTMAQEEFTLPDASDLDVKKEVENGSGKANAGVGGVGQVGGANDGFGKSGSDAVASSPGAAGEADRRGSDQRDRGRRGGEVGLEKTR